MALEVGYLDDSGKSYRVTVPTWEWNNTLGGTTVFNRRNARFPILPSSIRMRYVNAFLLSNPSIRRRFFLGNRIALKFAIEGKELLGLPLNVEDTGGNAQVIWIVSSIRGELRQF